MSSIYGLVNGSLTLFRMEDISILHPSRGNIETLMVIGGISKRGAIMANHYTKTMTFLDSSPPTNTPI